MRLSDTIFYQSVPCILTLAVALALPWSAGAQAIPVPQPAPFRADSALVLVPITVLDRRGAVVNGLPSDAFILSEDGVRQQIRCFSSEDVPASIGIVLDLSGSMRGVLGDAKESLSSLVKGAGPSDEAFLNVVSSRPVAYSGFTQNMDDLLSRVVLEGAGGNTALVDTVYDSLLQLRSGVHRRKALVVISDGMDNHSRRSKSELLERAMESDAQIYTVAVSAETSRYAKPIQLSEEKRGTLFLDELSAKTGGLSFVVRNRAEVDRATAAIGEALRNQYTIGYVPPDNSRNNQWHRIKVTVATPGLKAYARTGYRMD